MREKVRIKIGKDDLAGVLYYPDKREKYPAVIFFNGKGGTKERLFDICQHLLSNGYASFCFDFRGRGESVTKDVPPMKA